MVKRCQWCLGSDLMTSYHDKEWGVPVHNDRKIFEFLTLESAQAGLSWLTILKRREEYRRAFAGFRPEVVAKYGKRDVLRLLKDEGIIRNKLKIKAAITNAQQFLKVRDEFGSFDLYMWGFVGGKPKRNEYRKVSDLPATSIESGIWSKDLKKRGFSFVGSTIMYAHMQATGMVNDHVVDCFRYKEVEK